jgi:D-alanyl-D-alanine carboxypeptidase/D-alanyl-D-alanine-endopeptidase (penicillin-binding protein 4)
MAAAEAVYLSDPDAPSARRTFLDTVAAESSSFGRFQTLGADPGAPAPVLASLTDLASEGELDAIARLVELTPVALAAPGAADGLSELWDEVARDAPDDLVRVLAAAPAATSDAVVSSIARAVARAKEPEHPFVAALKRAQLDGDARVASYAHAGLPRLQEQLAAAKSLQQAGPVPTIGPASGAAPAPAPKDAPPTIRARNGDG